MRIFYLVPEFWGCAWYRCHVPGVELKKRGHHVVLNDLLTVDRVKEFDIIIIQRQFIASSLR